MLSDKMNCRGVVDKLGPQLLSVQIFFSMIADEQLWESIMTSRNCSQLSGESLVLCEEALSSRYNGYLSFVESDLNLELHNCYIEEKGNRSKYLSKR